MNNFGPALKTDDGGEKHWSPTLDKKHMWDLFRTIDEEVKYNDIIIWSAFCKYYGAEYIENDFDSLEGCLSINNMDAVELVRQVRDEY